MSHNTISTTYVSASGNPKGSRIDMVNGSLVWYDANNVPRGLFGQAPDDGRFGVWVSKPGQSVWTLLGGL